MMTYYEETLRKAYEYGGFRFWENYILSNIVRNLAEDIRVLGNKNVIDGYVCLYGEQVEDLMEYLVTQDIGLLEEASKLTDGLLFEDYLEPTIKRHNLVEQSAVDQARNSWARARLMEQTPGLVSTAGPIRGPSQISAMVAGSSGGLGSMLAGAWAKLKALGKSIFGPLVPYLKQGFAWAKGLARQGLAWFNATPWAKVLLPVLLITGSVAVAKRLLNRTRSKKVTKQEADSMKEYATKNSVKINEMRRKAGLKPITV
jgi:hypothetical protein